VRHSRTLTECRRSAMRSRWGRICACLLATDHRSDDTHRRNDRDSLVCCGVLGPRCLRCNLSGATQLFLVRSRRKGLGHVGSRGRDLCRDGHTRAREEPSTSQPCGQRSGASRCRTDPVLRCGGLDSGVRVFLTVSDGFEHFYDWLPRCHCVSQNDPPPRQRPPGLTTLSPSRVPHPRCWTPCRHCGDCPKRLPSLL
jgi:hypothetical protein